MTRVDLHPEDLLDHLRADDLRPEEHARLSNHCAVCSACAFEVSLIEGSRHVQEPTEADRRLGERALEHMLGLGHDTLHDTVSSSERDAPIPSATEVASSQAKVRGGSRDLWRAVALVLAGVLVGGSVSAAAWSVGTNTPLGVVWQRWIAPEATTAHVDAAVTRKLHAGPQPAVPVAPAPTVVETATDNAVVMETALAEAVAPDVASAPVTAPSITAARGTTTRSSRPGKHAQHSPVTEDPTTWLFRAARRARAEGRHQEAIALYRVVQRDYAGTEAELVASVAAGQLWLDATDNGGEALSAFEHYLRARPAGALAEEARAGRVRALRKLGRNSDADAAYVEMQTQHPHSVYAHKADPSAP